MDDKFMDSLRSFSMQDVLEEHRPATSYRTGTATSRRGPFTARPPTASRSQPALMNSEDGEITTLASYRPESAAFTFSFNRPNTGRQNSARPQMRSLPSSRSESRQAQGGNYDSTGLNNVRPVSSVRQGNRYQGGDETVEYIPDLEEVREEDLAMTVASAPAYEVQRMTSLKELDAELLHSKAFSVVNGVDMRKLCKFLVPEKDLIENDEFWTWDRLYTEIISTPELTHLVRFQKTDSE